SGLDGAPSMIRMRVSNWARSTEFHPAAFHRPESVSELQRLVAGSAHARALGTGHSFNELADTPGALISLERLPTEPELSPGSAGPSYPAGPSGSPGPARSPGSPSSPDLTSSPGSLGRSGSGSLGSPGFPGFPGSSDSAGSWGASGPSGSPGSAGFLGSRDS